MKLVPSQDWAVIRPSDSEEMTESGLYIPDTAKEKPHEGVVEAIGPGAYEEEKDPKKKEEKKERKFIPTTIKPGDRVLYERYADRTYTIDGEDLVLVREREILGTLPAKPEKKTDKPKPLQIPAITSAPKMTTSIVKRPTFPIITTPAHTEIRKPAVKAKKKAAGKKSSRKKVAKKAVKKTAKKTAKKAVKKAVKQPVKRSKSGSSASKKAKKK